MPKSPDCMEMPCMCDCGNWFDLNDGHPRKDSNIVVCEGCHRKEQEGPEGKERDKLRKTDIVWSYQDNASGNSGNKHGYYQNIKRQATALCNSHYHVSDGGSKGAFGIHEIDDDGTHIGGCGRCLRIYNKLPY